MEDSYNMATINTDLVMASVPQVDIAGAIGSGISSYYGVKEMQDAQTERDMLLEQRENEVWSSNYNRWKEWGNFVDPANADDYVAKGMEMGVYDQEQADMMLEQIQGSNMATGYPQLQHKLDTSLGVQSKADQLTLEREQLEGEIGAYDDTSGPLGYQQQQQKLIRRDEIDEEMINLSSELEAFDIPTLQGKRDEAYAASESSIQGAMNMWRGIGDAYEAFNAGKPYEMHKFNEETGSVETQNVTSEEELESLSDKGWEVVAPELSTYYDGDEPKIATPQMAYQRGYTEEAPVVEEVDVTGGYTGLAGQFFQAKGRAPKDAEELAAYRATIYPEDQETISITSEGITMTKGGIAPEDMGIAAKNALEQKIVQTNEAIGRLGEIQGSFKPEYLEAPTRLQTEISSFKAKLGRGESLTEDQQSELSNITAFRQDAFTNLNKTLNELSGAAVNQHEYERLLNQLPDPGKSGFTGILTGDDPIEFKRKMDESMATMKLANSRLMYMRQNGLMPSTDTAGNAVGFFDTDGSPIALDDMPSIIDNRGEELYSQYKQQFPDMSDAEITAMTGSAIKREFGL
jgi:hypothetical protein